MTAVLLHSLIRCVCGREWTAVYPPELDLYAGIADLECPSCHRRCAEVVHQLGAFHQNVQEAA